tara:strand:+ start:550 stop:1455 length:906 start_codon:yes stop_codon:yes gene_type:complete
MPNQSNYQCNLCDKSYKHRQSLHNHIKKEHPPESSQEVNQDTTSMYICKFCQKVYYNKQSKYRHQKKCKEEHDSLTKTIRQMEEKHKKEMEELKEILTKQIMDLVKKEVKISKKSIQNIGNQLNEGSTQNNVNNNITIVALGKEDVLNTLSEEEKVEILDKRFMSVLELVKLIHCSGKYPQFNNSLVTNIKSRYALSYDETQKEFVTKNKNELVQNIVSNRTNDIEDMLEEQKDNVSPVTNTAINDLLNILSDDTKKQNLEYINKYKDKILYAIYDRREELKQQLDELNEMKLSQGLKGIM